MTFEYFGVVTEVYKLGGMLKGLSRFEKGTRDPRFKPEQRFEPDGNIFVPKLPQSLRVPGTPVRFNGERNPNPIGPNLWWVKPEKGGSRLELHGFVIVGAAGFIADPAAVRPVMREDRILADGVQLYLRYVTQHGSCLRGPWMVRAGALHPIDSELYEWADKSWRAEDYFTVLDGAWEVLLHRLEPSEGHPLDFLSSEDLATWFLTKAESIPSLAEIVGQLHRDGRRLLKAEFKDLGEEAERRLFEARFSRVLSILETLEFGHSELQRIAGAPAFERLWQDALHSKTAELEAKAKAGLRDLRIEQESIEKSIGRLQHQQSELEAKVQKLSALEKKSKADLVSLHKKRHEVETYIGENQQRLLNDVRALVPLLSGRSSVATGAIQPFARIPALEKGEPGTPATNGLQSVTIQACRLTLLLDAFTARELAAALGWRMFVLQAEPHWLCSDDAWQAGLRSIFEAVASDGIPTLLHLQDLDRSPPELWFRPVLDLASGLRDVLMEGEREWPEALRITASLAPGLPRHPLGTWLLRHFAAPEPTDQQGGQGSAAGSHTREPTGRAAGAEPEPFAAAGLEPFVEREVRILTELLAKPSEAVDEEDRSFVEERARKIRREWPFTFGRLV